MIGEDRDDRPGDCPGDVAGDSRWLTYRQLAEQRGISPASAKRLAMRKRWRRQAGNDGIARVAVPMTESREAGPVIPDITGDITPKVNGLQAELAGLREAIATLRADHAAELDRLRQDHAAALGREAEIRADYAREIGRLMEAVTALAKALEAARSAPAARWAGWLEWLRGR